MLKWPDAETVDRAVRRWAHQAASRRPEVIRIGYFGSYARGDWGVGSDLDLIVVVEGTEQPFERRMVDWDVTKLPVPAEVLVYTRTEWEKLNPQGGRFARRLREEVVWVYERSR